MRTRPWLPSSRRATRVRAETAQERVEGNLGRVAGGHLRRPLASDARMRRAALRDFAVESVSLAAPSCAGAAGGADPRPPTRPRASGGDTGAAAEGRARPARAPPRRAPRPRRVTATARPTARASRACRAAAPFPRYRVAARRAPPFLLPALPPASSSAVSSDVGARLRASLRGRRFQGVLSLRWRARARSGSPAASRRGAPRGRPCRAPPLARPARASPGSLRPWNATFPARPRGSGRERLGRGHGRRG